MWILSLIFSQISSIVFSLFSRTALKKDKDGDTKAYTLIWQIFFALTALLLIPFFPFHLNISFSIIILFFLSTILFSVSNYTRFIAYTHEEASTLAPIYNISYISSILISIIFFHAAISLNIIIGFAIIIIAALLVTEYKEKMIFDKFIIYALISIITSSAAMAIDAHNSTNFSLPFYIFIASILQSMYAGILFRPKMQSIKNEFFKQPKTLILTAGLLSISYLLFLNSFTHGNTTEVFALKSTTVVLVTISAIVFLKERSRMRIKIISALIAAIGVVFISL